jgi:hypothetical protein
LEHLARHQGNAKAQVLADALDKAIGKFLDENKSPGPQGRSDRQPWQPLLPRAVLGRGPGRADADAELAARFEPVAAALRSERGRRSTPSCSPCRASRSTWAATTGPTTAKTGAADAPERNAQRHYRRDLSSDSRVRRRSAAPVASTGAALPSKAALSCLDS